MRLKQALRRLISKIHKAFANGSSANIKFSKTQLSKMLQLGRFLGALLGPLLKTGLHLIGNVLKPLAKKVLIPLRLIAAASETDVAIEKKTFGSGTTGLVPSNEDLKDIMKIIKSLEESGFLKKGVRETVEKEVNEEIGGFLGMLTATLGATLLGNMLAGKGVIRAGE